MAVCAALPVNSSAMIFFLSFRLREGANQLDGAYRGSVFNVHYADFPIALRQVSFISLHDGIGVIPWYRAYRSAIGRVDDASTAALEFDCVRHYRYGCLVLMKERILFKSPRFADPSCDRQQRIQFLIRHVS
jgi:hypothetical protein